jgi:hypothetical protein
LIRRTRKTVPETSKLKEHTINSVFKADKRDNTVFSKALYALENTNMKDIKVMVKSYNDLYHHLIVFKGKIWALRRLKSLHSCCTRYACSHEFEPLPFSKICDRNGLPLMAKPFKSYLQGSIADRRTALTILSLYKLVNVEANDYSLKTITKTNPFKEYQYRPNSPGRFLLYAGDLQGLDSKLSRKIALAWREVLRETYPSVSVEDRVNSVRRLNSLHMSSKAGPNGSSMSSIPIDYVALRRSPDLYNSMKFLANAFDHKSLNELIKEYERDAVLNVDDFGMVNASKLSLKQESGARVRVFGIGDWFSQSVLLGMSLDTDEWLINQPEDCTHDQDRGTETVRVWTETEGLEIESHDLTAATDSLPVILQREIIAQKYGEDIAYHWMNLMTNRVFTGPKYEKVRYSVGQPMGLYSSFTALAEWHHLTFRTVLKLLGRKRNPEIVNYVVLGDDSANFKELSHFYLLIIKMCQIGISPMKGYGTESKRSYNIPINVEHSVAEFAKRVFIDGHEITGISPILILDGSRYPSDYCDLLRESERRGYNLRQHLPRVVFLAELGFNPKNSIVTASFPIWPVPPLIKVRGGVTSKMVWLTLTEKYSIIWNKFKMKELRYWTRKHLLDKLNTAIAESKVGLVNILTDLIDVDYVTCPKYDLRSEAHVLTIKMIINNLIDRIELLHSELGSSSLDIVQKTTGEDELVRMINKFKVINDINDIIHPSSHQYLSTETRLSRLISEVANDVGKSLPLFSMSATLANGQVRIVTIDGDERKTKE